MFVCCMCMYVWLCVHSCVSVPSDWWIQIDKYTILVFTQVQNTYTAKFFPQLHVYN